MGLLGGSIALLALNTLFILIRDHNLCVFYTSNGRGSQYFDLYSGTILTFTLVSMPCSTAQYYTSAIARGFSACWSFFCPPRTGTSAHVFVFTHQNHRHLPATLLASFVKRLARLSLTASPAAITIIFPFIYNTLKHHPSLMLMVHREVITNTFEDPFLPKEPSPLQTRAIDSSLWELQTHIHHYVPPVGTLARIFSEPFTKPSYVLEDFLDHTYDTVRDDLFLLSIPTSLMSLVVICC